MSKSYDVRKAFAINKWWERLVRLWCWIRRKPIVHPVPTLSKRWQVSSQDVLRNADRLPPPVQRAHAQRSVYRR